MTKTEIILTEIMRGVSSTMNTPWEKNHETEILTNVFADYCKKMNSENRVECTGYCPPHEFVYCTGACRSCWDKAIEKIQRKGESPCL